MFGYGAPAVAKLLEAVLAHVRCEATAAETVLSALHFGERLGCSRDDSEIIASTLAAECGVLYSEV